jgi:anti-sigma factor RsiW
MAGQMFRFKYHYCKRRMVAYINGELSERSRRRMARYIDECADCHAEYTRQRCTQREIHDRLPSIGRPQAGQLDRIWTAIQADLSRPATANYQPQRFQLRYGFAVMLMVAALVFPLLFSDGGVSPAAATQPTPDARVAYVDDTVATERPAADGTLAQVLTESAASTPAPNMQTEATIAPEAVPQRIPEQD